MDEYFLEYEYIDSVKYRNKIKSLVDSYKLQEKTGISNFCMCICFRDNNKYFLSNMPDWAIEYHKIGGPRSDEVFNLELMRNKNFFIPRHLKYDYIQRSLVVQEEKFKYFDTYSLIRRNVDCSFVFLALHNNPCENPQKIYTDSQNEFESFCLYLIENMLKEIKDKNSAQKSLLVFNNSYSLKEVIRHGTIRPIKHLAEREKECIKLLRNNYPPKLIATSMNITEKTVRNYINSIREKLECNSILDIIEKSIQYDL